MPSMIVCPYCRKTCAICHASAEKNGFAFIACHDCWRKYESKCYCCGGKKSGPGTAGATGTGRVCGKCYKSNFCPICKQHL